MNKYPRGKIHESDEGELRMAVSIQKDRVIVDFGKDLSWIGFDTETLRNFIDSLEVKYQQLTNTQKHG